MSPVDLTTQAEIMNKLAFPEITQEAKEQVIIDLFLDPRPMWLREIDASDCEYLKDFARRYLAGEVSLDDLHKEGSNGAV